MKKMLSLVTLATILTAVSFAADAAPLPVEGSWGTSFQNNGIMFDITMKLENQMITTTNICTVAGQSLTAAVTVPASYDQDSITVLGHGQNEVSENGRNCNVSVRPDRMRYQIIGNRLVLSHDGSPGQFVLIRR
jgi:hypothetical protein